MNADKSAKSKLVLALDVDTKEEARSLIYELKDYVGTFKVGLQLLSREGPEIVRMIKGEGCNIFYDGKFHDIPNTVAKASANATRLGVDIFDIHTSGGSKMIKAAVQSSIEAAQELNISQPIILGITILSSIDQETLSDELNITVNIDDYVTRLAKIAKKSNLSGIVASVKEVEKIRKACGEDFIILCPGIRPQWAATNDQKRIATPKEAIKLGANLLVIGRPITAADDRVKAAQMIIEEIEQAMELIPQPV